MYGYLFINTALLLTTEQKVDFCFELFHQDEITNSMDMKMGNIIDDIIPKVLKWAYQSLLSMCRVEDLFIA